MILFGEDVAVAGGVFAVTPGLHEKYGDERVFDTPISELAMTGAAYRRRRLRPAAGARDHVRRLPAAVDGLPRQPGGQVLVPLRRARTACPLVVRSVVGAGGRFGAIHSQMPIAWFDGVPGLKIVAPSTPADAKGLLKSAIRDENPVLFFEHKRLYSLKGETGERADPARSRAPSCARAAT